MKVVLCFLGTLGDLNPAFLLGKALVERGHEVVLASAERYEKQALLEGLRFVRTLDESSFQRVLNDPGLWQRLSFFQVVLGGFVVPTIDPLVDWAKAQPRPQEWLFVSDFSSGVAARIASQLTGGRQVSVWLSPAALRSTSSPPVLAAAEPVRHLPGPLKRTLSHLVYATGESIAARQLKSVRQQHGLKPLSTPLRDMHSTLGSIAFFPQWFAAEQYDDVPNLKFAGFPCDHKGGRLTEDAEAFLGNGKPPIILTLGSGMQHATSELRSIARTCLEQGQRVVVVSTVAQELELPPHPDLLLARYLPFKQLFPRSKLVVHHGGIGTSAQALKAGIPQLVVPFAHDQPDNAVRLESLGVALTLHRCRISSERISQALQKLEGDARLERCREISQRLTADGQALKSACEHLEQLSSCP